jgi:tRNA threonylcarbamoyladenosine biosynthesis protein TsaB
VIRRVEGPVLGIETSGPLTGVALCRDGRLVGEASIELRASRRAMLLLLVQRMLDDHGLEPEALARVGVSLGPGSFTGLRVGLAAARALAYGSGGGLVGVPSHQALAYPYRGTDAILILLTGMRRGRVCVEVGSWESGRWVARFPAASLPGESVWERIEAAVGGSGSARLLFLGEAVESAFEACPDLAGKGPANPETPALARRPAVVAVLAAEADREESRGPDLDRLAPIYLRSADARRPVGRS